MDRSAMLGMMIGGTPQYLTTHSFALSTGIYTNTRATSWGGGNTAPGDQIACVFSATWADAAHVTEFWNAGGQIRFHLSQPGGSSQDINWSTVLSTGMGTLIFSNSATAISGTGTGGTVASTTGYSGVASQTTIYTGDSSGAYSTNLFTIAAVQVTNGVKFTVTLTDAHSGSSDSVDSGTALVVDVLHSVGSIATVVPTFTTVSGF